MDLKEQGIPLVGTYCTFMPQEIPEGGGRSRCAQRRMKTHLKKPKDLPRNPARSKAATVGKPTNAPIFTFPTW